MGPPCCDVDEIGGFVGCDDDDEGPVGPPVAPPGVPGDEVEGWVGDKSWALSLSLSRPGLKDSSSCSTRSSVGPQR